MAEHIQTTYLTYFVDSVIYLYKGQMAFESHVCVTKMFGSSYSSLRNTAIWVPITRVILAYQSHMRASTQGSGFIARNAAPA